MRKIKFRGKNAKGEWVFGSLIVSEIENDKGKFKVAFIAPDLPFASDGGDYYTTKVERVKIETICQFTGLIDEYGTEVYEGDIVIMEGEPENKRIVAYYEEAFNIATVDEYCRLLSGAHPYFNDYAHMNCLNTWSNTGLVRVIGNIYDDPDIFGSKELIELMKKNNMLNPSNS